jgi:hypothetical protein
LHSFTRERLLGLFTATTAEHVELIGAVGERTNRAADWLMHRAGYPWGSYGQAEPCIACGEPLRAPESRSFAQRLAGKAAVILNRVQSSVSVPFPAWIQVRLRRTA